MKIIEATDLSVALEEAVLALWNSEYPKQLQYLALANFEQHLANLVSKKHYLLFCEENKLAGWCFSFVRDNAKWFAIIVDKQYHGKGYGTKLLNHLKATETVLNGWVIDNDQQVLESGECYKSPLVFYIKNNFMLCPGVRLETEKLSAVKIVWQKQ